MNAMSHPQADRNAVQLAQAQAEAIAVAKVPLSWGDLVALARSNHVLGIHWITRLRDEAVQLADHDIAREAQGYLDTHEYPEDARQYLDELDSYLFPDPDPLQDQFIERISPSVFGGYR